MRNLSSVARKREHVRAEGETGTLSGGTTHEKTIERCEALKYFRPEREFGTLSSGATNENAFDRNEK